MKYNILSLIAAACITTACFGIEDENYPELSPITITTKSDTINVQQGVMFSYSGLSVESADDVSYEWVYGAPANGTKISDHKFSSYEVISKDAEINYTFPKIGTFLMRLKVDNGESILYHFFTLNVNASFDEGILVLNNAEDGKGQLSFIKTLTPEETEAGVQEFYDDIFGASFKSYTLRNGTSMRMSYSNQSKYSAAGLLIATNDGEGTIYQIEPKTFEMTKASSMAEFETCCKEFGGTYAAVGGFINYFVGANGHVFSYDYQIGYINDLSDIFPQNMERCIALVNRTSATAATTDNFCAFGKDSFCNKAGTSSYTYTPDGYDVINIATIRTGTNSKASYILTQSESEPDSYQILNSTVTNTMARPSAVKTLTSFTADRLCMDRSSKFVETMNANDAYYTYDNAIYRWPLTSKPATTPSIKLPEGELIRDIATNFKGKEKGTEGEDLLYVVTYNPSRAGEKKGSLYIYRFSDETLVKSYEGIFYDPVSVIYKYRLS